ncbi:Sensory/regulatory protein RpfC [Delftia tsuruhatensis]|uniref:Hpt domain-containing response regulator n=1 Tax=Delftia tsuruhatensis TaxID=180282 RepID=UPI001E7F8031|nr:response regulator [Delftia tsuruhatensis]CAB5694883.1 Sensory/regulatory protein RpfC [Delftia tsuruhatensis]CAC9687066.1 Sensory/regulatory protein RpfC [Delftia tsuruhatensis]
MSPAPAHVLLVEDDPSIARFVAMVLDEMPLVLTVSTSAEDALEKMLAAGGGPAFSLLITDLMLPGMSGVELIERLNQSCRGSVPTVVFSAGVDPEMQQRLESLQVLRILRKPVSVAQLLECVGSALQAPESLPGAGAATAQAPQDRAAVDAFFEGDAVLFLSYRAACLAQMPLDLAQGQHLLDAREAAGLRRLAHSLKSVLRMLGRAPLADAAQVLEQMCLQQDWEGAQGQWQWLQAQLRRLMEDGATA